jgi:hypothetical protein
MIFLILLMPSRTVKWPLVDTDFDMVATQEYKFANNKFCQMCSYVELIRVHFLLLFAIIRTQYFFSSSVSCGEMKLTVSCSKSSVPLLAEIFHINVHKTGKEHFRVLKYEGVSPMYLISICSIFSVDSECFVRCNSDLQIKGV